MINFPEAMIKEAAASNEVYRRGMKYYMDGRVTDFRMMPEDIGAFAVVVGSEPYEVDIDFLSSGEIFDMYFDCPAFNKYKGACKHIIALLKVCQDFNRNRHSTVPDTRRAESKQQLVEKLFDYIGSNTKGSEKIPLNLEINFQLHHDFIYGTKKKAVRNLSLRIGEERLYSVKNIKALLEAIDQGEEIEYGKHFVFKPHIHQFKAEDQPLMELLMELYQVERDIFNGLRYSSNRFSNQARLFNNKHVVMPDAVTKKFLASMKNRLFNATILNKDYKNVGVIEQDLPLEFILNKSNNDFVLDWEQNDVSPLVSTGDYFFYGGQVYKVSDYQRDNFAPLATAFMNTSGRINFSPKQKERFASQVLPVLKRLGRVNIAEPVRESFYEVDLKPEVYLDKVDDLMTGRVSFIYGDVHLNPFAGAIDYRLEDRVLVRDIEKEGRILDLIEQAEFRTMNGSIYIEDEENIFAFVYNFLPDLQALADVYYSDSFRDLRVRDTVDFSGGVRLNEENDMLEFSFGLEGIDQSEVKDVFSSLREKKKYYRLRDGSFLPLESAGPRLEQVMNMLDSLDISQQQLSNTSVELPKYRAVYVDGCLREFESEQVERNLAFKQLVQNICEPQDMDFQVPESLNVIMRDYQKRGFKWLKTLAAYCLGGILADDMGLGKTLQTIAFLISEKEKLKLPSMVVAPTSVVYNWREEAKRFAPGLKTMVVSGTPQIRREQIAKGQEVDLVITSYALIRKDLDYYKNIDFAYCFLDEAQNIKNPGSLSAKAVKMLKARGRFVLTGTPIENGLTELWSIFDFIMPGYLFSRQKFRKKYELPIIKNGDSNALSEFQKQISPFIMRRMKKEVLKELPPKVESKVLTELTRDQKKLYLAYLKEAKGEIEQEIAVRGFERSQIKILAVLTRLRQICCHPAMFLEDYHSDSGKLLHLEEILAEAIQGGHRVLLFSQFTTMLAIIKKHLDREHVNYFSLDGSTKAQERDRLVRAFNQGEGDVFLISLKAGGTGLNLTGADVVIHYDPWWNPAVEDQATDRAYRIGQTNSVQVIKLITKGTIEERIFELQAKKKAMIESVIKPGETMLSKMTAQDVQQLFESGDSQS